MFEFKSPPYEPEDFPTGVVPDPEVLSPRTVMTYGTTLGDIRTCIVGNTTNMFHDFEVQTYKTNHELLYQRDAWSKNGR